MKKSLIGLALLAMAGCTDVMVITGSENETGNADNGTGSDTTTSTTVIEQPEPGEEI